MPLSSGNGRMRSRQPGPIGEERADLDERRPARDREPAGGGDPVVDERRRCGPAARDRAPPARRARRAATTSPRSNATSSSETTSQLRARPTGAGARSGAGASHPDRIPTVNVRQVVDDLVERPPGRRSSPRRARARRARGHAARSVRGRCRRARPGGRTTASQEGYFAAGSALDLTSSRSQRSGGIESIGAGATIRAGK